MSALIPDVKAEQVDRLEAFADLLVEIAIPRGFVAAGDAARVFERHVADSVRGALAIPAGAATALDAGSGAGLPGIPVAIVAPNVAIMLVEPRRARAAFLELVVERLRLTNVMVVVGRVEDVPEEVDVVFARAFAPVEDSWVRLRRLLHPGGRLVYFAGVNSPDPARPPGATALDVLRTPVLATSGPLFIIAR